MNGTQASLGIGDARIHQPWNVDRFQLLMKDQLGNLGERVCFDGIVLCRVRRSI